MSPWKFTLQLEIYTFYPWHCFKGCLDGGCDDKKHNARYSLQLQTGTGRRASLKTVPPPWDRLSLGGQSELISWWFVTDHIHGTSSSTPMLRYNRSALAVTRANNEIRLEKGKKTYLLHSFRNHFCFRNQCFSKASSFIIRNHPQTVRCITGTSDTPFCCFVVSTNNHRGFSVLRQVLTSHIFLRHFEFFIVCENLITFGCRLAL